MRSALLRISALLLIAAPLSAEAGPTTRARFQNAALQDTWQGPYRPPSAGPATRATTPSPPAGSVSATYVPPPQSLPPQSAPGITPSTPPSSAPSSASARPNRGSSATPRSEGSRASSASRGAGGFAPRNAVDYVIDTYAQNNVAVDGRGQLSVVELYRQVQQRGTVYHGRAPATGDLVFFHNTHDDNSDGRNNDWYAHVGIVEQVMGDGTIVVLSWRNGAVSRDTMNLRSPREVELEGRVVNTPLRAYNERDPQFTQYLAGELFAGFGSMLGDLQSVVVLDTWRP